MGAEKITYPFSTEIGIYKKQIDDQIDPSKNHPIHDAVEKISYGRGRYDLIVVLDGVSESKSDKKLVPIGRMLSWDLARFCQESAPEDLEELVGWFRSTTAEAKYEGKGNTTVALVRFDRSTGEVDGFTAGDSVVLLAVDRLEADEDGEQELTCQAEVVAPLHCVANYPGVIYNGWRAGMEFQPERFRFTLPEQWVNAYLVTMSDGYGKISDDKAAEIFDFNEADQILARRFPDFARVYLPQALVSHASDVRRSRSGRVLRSDIADREELWQSISDYYDADASEEERRELELIDLDCRALRDLMLKPPAEVAINGKPAEEILAGSHRTLTWMTRARYMDNEDETGLEEYLRQYVMAELFVQAMIEEMFAGEGSTRPLHLRLHGFGESLGAVGDDFSVALVKIMRSE